MLDLLKPLDNAVLWFVRDAPPALPLTVWSAIGLVVGNVLTTCVRRLPRGERLRDAAHCDHCHVRLPIRDRVPVLSYLLRRGKCRDCGQPIGVGVLLVEAGTALLFASLWLAVVQFGSQTFNEGGHRDWIHWRVISQSVLIALLVVATAIDFELYLIPDQITVVGTLFGVALATMIGNLQILPLWVDWNDLLVNIHGPYIPDWIKQHWYAHGLAWSLTGVVTGGGITWLVRALSQWVLGQEALGFGDVTLMAMIGSFLGWQPVVFVFVLAPLCGLVVGLLLRFTTGRVAVPYGPYLSLATLLVLFGFRWMWIPSREIFGDPKWLAVLAGGSITGMVLLLGLLRLFRSIPVTIDRRAVPSEDSAPDD
ncbi:MAG: prepilin peptidase [Planctomycetales bacterium]|nr:prepilin peptidase [Planctomycetales bacterium]